MGNNKKHKKSASTFEIERLDPLNSPWFAKKLVLEHLERYKFASRLCNGKIVIDMGSGTGYGSRLIAKRGAKKVYAFEIDPKAVVYAKKKYFNKKIIYTAASAENTKLPDNSVDLVTCFEVIEHLKKPKDLINEIYRVLKPGGIVIISTPNKITSFNDNPFHIKEFTLKELSTSLDMFSNQEYFGQRKVNLGIINIYQSVHKLIPFKKLKFLLKLRPWESYKIEKIKNINNPSYLYLFLTAKK